jgi:hypothetical protein
LVTNERGYRGVPVSHLDCGSDFPAYRILVTRGGVAALLLRRAKWRIRMST